MTWDQACDTLDELIWIAGDIEQAIDQGDVGAYPWTAWYDVKMRAAERALDAAMEKEVA